MAAGLSTISRRLWNLYKVVLLSESEKFYRRLFNSNKKFFKRIDNALESLKSNPFSGQPLKYGLKGKYSLRVGQFRIIYSVEQEIVTVFVLDIAHRKDVYR